MFEKFMHEVDFSARGGVIANKEVCFIVAHRKLRGFTYGQCAQDQTAWGSITAAFYTTTDIDRMDHWFGHAFNDTLYDGPVMDYYLTPNNRDDAMFYRRTQCVEYNQHQHRFGQIAESVRQRQRLAFKGVGR